MKVVDYSFRELDRKLVGIENKRMCKKIAKKIKQKHLICPIFGYFYIDKESGLTFRVLGNISRDGHNKLYIDEDFIIDDNCVIDYSFMTKYEVEVVSDDVKEYIDGISVLENKLEINYKNEHNFLETRNMELLDQFRDQQFPDDIQVLFKSDVEDANDEILWARIKGKETMNGKDVIVCKLLSSSYYNEDLQEGKLIMVRYSEEDEQFVIMVRKK